MRYLKDKYDENHWVRFLTSLLASIALVVFIAVIPLGVLIVLVTIIMGYVLLEVTK